MKIRAALLILFFVLFTVANASEHIYFSEQVSSSTESKLLLEEGFDDIELSCVGISPSFSESLEFFNTLAVSFQSNCILHIYKPPK